MIRWIEPLLFRLRTRRLRRELDHALKLRRRGRARRQEAARKGARTRRARQSEKLNSLKGETV